MNLDDVMEVWRSQDLSALCGVDKTVLHRALQQEQARLEKHVRRARWFMYVVTAVLFVAASLFLAIMIYPNDDDVLVVWDYVVGTIGVAATLVLAGALFAMHRARRARTQVFGDSLRDHLRRRISELDDEAKRERRMALITVVVTWIAGWAISMAAARINDVPYGELNWLPLPFPIVVTILLFCLWLFASAPRRRQRNAARKRQLQALLQDLDDDRQGPSR